MNLNILHSNWREEARRLGYVCQDCNEPIRPDDRLGFLERGRRCKSCYYQIQEIKARTEYERQAKPKCP